MVSGADCKFVVFGLLGSNPSGGVNVSINI